MRGDANEVMPISRMNKKRPHSSATLSTYLILEIRKYKYRQKWKDLVQRMS